MSMPNTIYEATRLNGELRRERSLAMHENLMHLPQGESLLKRLLERLRRKPGRALESRKSETAGEQVNTNRPPAFSG